MKTASPRSPNFADRLVRDAERGEWRDGETRYLLVRQDSLMGLFRRLPPSARVEALAALGAAVAEAGGRSAKRYRETIPGGSAALLEVVAETAAHLGWGVWTFALPSAGELRLDVANSPFAAGFGPSPGPVCAAIAGMAGTIAATLLGRSAMAEETRCAAAGAETCQFVARSHRLMKQRSSAMPPRDASSHLANPLLVPSGRGLPKVVAIIGAGSIGPDIAYYLMSAIPGLKLHLVDVAQSALERAMQRLHDYAAKAVQRQRMTTAEADHIVAGIHPTLDYDSISGADWVLEAATEDLALKRKIFARVEAIVRPQALITSNTSSLPAARIFSDLSRRERATVTHFFAPAWRNPIVEVIRWPGVDPSVVADLNWLFCMTGKVPLVTDDVPCFMLDRIFDNWCNEAALLLGRASAAEIDSVAGAFVHAGPFFVLNLAHGNPIIVETNTLQADEEGEHYRPAPIFRSVESWATVAPGRTVAVKPAVVAEVRDRMLGILVSQTADILDRNIGAAADLELGCRLALGFKSGPLDLMRDAGAAELTRVMARLATERPGLPLPHRPVAAYQDFRRFVLVDRIDDVMIVTLRRPEALNALHDGMTDEILDVIQAAEDDDGVTGFVITGYGPRAFSAGADIGRFPAVLGDREAAAWYARDCSRLLVHLDGMAKPVVAALNGMALGGGLELALRCHDIVALGDAWLQLPEITLGIVPGIGAMVVPYRRWPAAAPVFHDMLRRAAKLTAAKAAEIGMIAALADDYAGLIDCAILRVKGLAGQVRGPRNGPVAISAPSPADPVAASGQRLSGEVIGILERAVREAAAAPDLNAALEIGYRAFAASACTAAAREGIDAFLQRRAPDFERTG